MSKVIKVGTDVCFALALLSACLYLVLSRSGPPATTGPSDIEVPLTELPALESGLTMGPESSPQTLVQFGDYQCPPCKAYEPAVEEFLAKHTDVKFVFHHFPLDKIHPRAFSAAAAAEAAARQGKFWEMHTKLYASQDEWGNAAAPEKIYEAYAETLGLDLARFRGDLVSPEADERIRRSRNLGLKIGVRGTPTFLVNGRSFMLPKSPEAFEAALQSAFSQ